MIPGFSAAPMMIRAAGGTMVTFETYDGLLAFISAAFAVDFNQNNGLPLGSISNQPLPGNDIGFIAVGSGYIELFLYGDATHVTSVKLGAHTVTSLQIEIYVENGLEITSISGLLSGSYSANTPYLLELS